MDATDRRVVGEEKANIDQLPDPDHLASHEMWLCIMASSRGVFLGIRGGGVPPGTPDPDRISQPRPQGPRRWGVPPPKPGKSALGTRLPILDQKIVIIHPRF